MRVEEEAVRMISSTYKRSIYSQTRVVSEQRTIRAADGKVESGDENRKILVIGSRSLFKTIKSIAKTTIMMKKSGTNRSGCCFI